ncbi:4Fe-4S dicluster domain-containing protein [Carboxylicivirga sp. M1479]|uniref:4Fe-4S dicluster domain-containing protein n=1 Tax=Carboxylicivirga sp. M1479 TaxID=2594476 RepID=UPI0011781DE8|nr:4Fe-4S dicluster domain-containing protein [Carboxylicivirga sp. M1479]TRX63287.1 4Fe-4S dicluster domain-containing protein [Carboxylicivirga sp. M1479]
MQFFRLTLAIIAIGIILLMLLMLFTSIIEKRKGAALKACILLLPGLLLLLAAQYLSSYFDWVIAAFDILVLAFGAYLLVPRLLFSIPKEDLPKGNIDERTVMFARNEIKPNTERYDSFYKEHPDLKENDDNFRQLPGLLSKHSTFYNPLAYEASDAIFHIVDSLHKHVEGDVKEQAKSIDPKDYQKFITEWTKKSGAKSVGFTKMKDYHWYSVGGRGERYGKPIEQKHTVGIAFTVEMDHEMVKPAPKSSIIMESATQYLQAGIIATQLAQFIRNSGFEARAHIDGNYQVVAPLVARDANLGEIGRMGLLMTEKLGPRVRVGVVTTNMPLDTVERAYNNSFEDFCDKCLKCATNCPASAISDQPKEMIKDVNRWQINSEKCFNYWCTAGTDCGRCMSTCPYSHPNNLLHNIVRWSINQFPNFRYWAVKMDDFFYGRKTKSEALPGWLKH